MEKTKKLIRKIAKIAFIVLCLAGWNRPIQAADVAFIANGAEILNLTISTSQTGTLETVNVTGGFSGTLTWSFLIAPTPNPAGIDVVLPAPSGATANIDEVGAFNATDDFSFQALVEDSGSPGMPMLIEVNVYIRNPLSFVMVLDNSGSMMCEPGFLDSNWPCTPPADDADSRWGILKDNVDAFLTAFDDTVDGDQVGVVYFAGNVKPSPTGLADLIDATDSDMATDIVTDLNDGALNPPGGGTSMGDGMVQSKTVLTGGSVTTGSIKNVLLFSDGQDNTTAEIETTGSDAYTVTAEAVPQTLTDGNTRVYTIATEESSFGNAATLMEEVANEHMTGMSGSYFTDGGLTIDDFFDNVLQTLFSLSSPQLVANGRDRVTGDQKELSFTIEKGVSNLQFKVRNLNRSFPPNITIFKDGVPIQESRNIKTKTGERYSWFSIDLPAVVNGSRVESEGTWTMRVRRAGNFYYSVIANNHATQVDFSLGEDRVVVGDQLRPAVQLSIRDSAITDATVRLQLTVPGEDIGDFLAKTTAKFDPTSAAEAGSVGYQKLQSLIGNDDFANAIRSRTLNFNLTHKGNGRYETNQAIPAALKGLYTAKFFVESSSTSVGTFFRTRTVQVQVLAPAPDPGFSDATIAFASPQGVSTFQLVYTPGYRHNGVPRLYGPTYGNSIKVQGVGAYTVTDNGDGSYTIQGDGSPTDNIVLQVGRENVFTGQLSDVIEAGTGGGKVNQKGTLGLFLGGGSVNSEGVGALGLEYLFQLANLGQVNLLIGPYADGMYFFSDPNNLGLAAGGLAALDYKSANNFWFRAYGKYGVANYNLTDEVTPLFLNDWDNVAGGGLILGYAGNTSIGLKLEYGQILQGLNNGESYFLIGAGIGF